MDLIDTMSPQLKESLFGDSQEQSLSGDIPEVSPVGDSQEDTLIGDIQEVSPVGDSQEESLSGDIPEVSLVGDSQAVCMRSVLVLCSGNYLQQSR